MRRSVIAWLALWVAAMAAAPAAGQTHGRATLYDGGQQGSCGFGSSIPSFFAAYPDVQAGYQGSCGQCFLVSCDPVDVSDGNGGTLQRKAACKDPDKEILVEITDTCPCNGNRQWCCGDMPHLDLSRAAFSQLADEVNGVIGIKWRPAACVGQPSRQPSPSPAVSPSPSPSPSPLPSASPSPSPWDASTTDINPPPKSPSPSPSPKPFGGSDTGYPSNPAPGPGNSGGQQPNGQGLDQRPSINIGWNTGPSSSSYGHTWGPLPTPTNIWSGSTNDPWPTFVSQGGSGSGASAPPGPSSGPGYNPSQAAASRPGMSLPVTDDGGWQPNTSAGGSSGGGNGSSGSVLPSPAPGGKQIVAQATTIVDGDGGGASAQAVAQVTSGGA